MPDTPHQVQSDPEETLALRKECEMLEGYWSRRLELYKRQNEDLKQKLESLSEVQLKHPVPKLPSTHTQPASQMQQQLEDCLTRHRGQPLKCSKEVRDFAAWTRGQ